MQAPAASRDKHGDVFQELRKTISTAYPFLQTAALIERIERGSS